MPWALDQASPTASPASSSRRRLFLKLALLLALAHFALLCLVDGALFVAAHIPPKAFNLDGLVLFLLPAHQVLRAPRLFLQWIWPGEITPWLLTWPMAPLNSLIWGSALAGLKLLVRH